MKKQENIFHLFYRKSTFTIKIIVCLSSLSAPTYSNTLKTTALLDISIEDLANVKVTSVSKQEESLSNAAASIYVITSDAIRRAGIHSLPEALRLAPNLQVAKIDSNRYAISARGFNSSTANKLQVLIDGRIIYTPLYSGVFWDSQDILLQDIERIEVISGPGGTLWGVNAVNGVINVITKKSSRTQGRFVEVSGGNIVQHIALRQGGYLDDNKSYRIYGKFNQENDSIRHDGQNAKDEWDRWQIGFRTDWDYAKDNFTIMGNTYQNSIDQASMSELHNSGTNLLTRWNKILDKTSDIQFQLYFDNTQRESPGIYAEDLNIVNIDFQHSFIDTAAGKWIWGGEYRVMDDHVTNSNALAFLPPERNLYRSHLFIQHQRDIVYQWQLTLGGTMTYGTYIGEDFLPNIKLARNITRDGFLWVNLARSIRAPSRIDRDFYISGNPPYLLAGGPNFRSEKADTIEIGWRETKQLWSYSLVGFYSEYDYLRSLDPVPGGGYVIGNGNKGDVSGIETSVNYKFSPSWSLDAGALILDESFEGDNLALARPGNDPDHQWQLRSKWNIDSHHWLDVSVRRVGELSFPAIPAYTAVDAHYGWMLQRDMELSLALRNMFDPYHPEFASGSGAQASNPIQVEREIYLSLMVKL